MCTNLCTYVLDYENCTHAVMCTRHVVTVITGVCSSVILTTVNSSKCKTQARGVSTVIAREKSFFVSFTSDVSHSRKRYGAIKARQQKNVDHIRLIANAAFK